MPKARTNLYEGMFILNATLSEEARKKALDRITYSMIERGGEVVKVFDQGRRKLAYEVDGKREGYYFLVYFNLPSLSVTDLWREYHLNEDLLRFITLRAESVPESLEFKSLVQA